jgi:hypothetical protein
MQGKTKLRGQETEVRLELKGVFSNVRDIDKEQPIHSQEGVHPCLKVPDPILAEYLDEDDEVGFSDDCNGDSIFSTISMKTTRMRSP